MRPPTLTDRRHIYHVPKEEFTEHYLEVRGLKDPKWWDFRLPADYFEHSFEYAYLGLIERVNGIQTRDVSDPDGVIIYLNGLEEGFYWDQFHFSPHQDKRYKDSRRFVPFEGEIVLMLPYHMKQYLLESCEPEGKRHHVNGLRCHGVSLLRQHDLATRVEHFDRPAKRHILGLEGGRR
ncbi:MAG: hypothetical protein KJ709_04500 [Nanoarchaeota archaeon]|nr:hypothetical protein [Nanoarchaeota archaeon]